MAANSIRRYAAAATVVGLVVGFAPTPAFAAGTCSNTNICMFEDSGYNGSKYVDYHPGSVPQDKFEIDWWNGDNEISSVINNSGKYAIIFPDDGWDGDSADIICIGPGVSVSNLRNQPYDFNDDAESFMLSNSCRY